MGECMCQMRYQATTCCKSQEFVSVQVLCKCLCNRILQLHNNAVDLFDCALHVCKCCASVFASVFASVVQVCVCVCVAHSFNYVYMYAQSFCL